MKLSRRMVLPLGAVALLVTGLWQSADAQGNRLRAMGLFVDNDVARIYVEPQPSGAAIGTTAQATTREIVTRTVAVPGTTRWVDTGIVVRQGDMVAFESSGEVRLSDDPNDTASPAGSHAGRRATGAPLPGTFVGALIARAGNSQPVAIGAQAEPLRMAASGRLGLGVNDDERSDNSGVFTVTVRAPLQWRRGRAR